MRRNGQSLKFLVVALVIVNTELSGQEFEAKLAGTRLPNTLYVSSAVYDGVDNVYLFGGVTEGGDELKDILRYTISLDKVEKVSSLSSGTYGGLALQAKDGKTIYFFGGYPNYNIVHKFDSTTNVTIRLSTELPSLLWYTSGVSINGTILLFDVHERQILEFSEETESARIIAELSFFNGTSVAAIPDNKDGIWLFAGNLEKPTYPILQFNTTTKAVQIPSVNTTSLPKWGYLPASVRDISHGYLIGGIGEAPEEDGSYHPGNGMLRVQLDDATTEFIPVANFPAGIGSYFDYTTAVYVAKLNRIYIFGGYTHHRCNGTSRLHDSIWYIELPSSPPLPAFDCSNLTHGSYPHPTDCSSFFVCVDGELAGEYTCPPTLLFDPVQQTCNFPEEVVCFFSCEGKEGLFPHPSDCRKFLGCRDGSPNVEIFDCPEPLLFDPVLLKCDLPQFVNCFAELPIL